MDDDNKKQPDADIETRRSFDINSNEQPTHKPAPQPAPQPPEPAKPRRSSWIVITLWVVTLLCLGPVLTIGAIVVYMQLTGIGSAPHGGLAALILLSPTYFIVPYFAWAGLATSLALIIFDRGLPRKLLAGLAAFAFSLSLMVSMQFNSQTRINDEVLSADETIRMLEQCRLKAVVKDRPSEVTIIYFDEDDSLPRRAAPDGYKNYIETIKSVNCAQKVHYQNAVPGEPDDPAWPGDRWVSHGEAVGLLEGCEVETVIMYGNAFTAYPDDPITGEQTDYLLREGDNYTKPYLYIYSYTTPDQELQPLTTNYKARCASQEQS